MSVEILDIHSPSSKHALAGLDLSKELLDGLSRPTGEKYMPSMLLYDEQGLRHYDEMTIGAAEYYLFAAEEEILKHYADDIVGAMHRYQQFHSGSDFHLTDEVVLELGSGALRKTLHILLGLSRFAQRQELASPITYYALDLDKRELERTLGEIHLDSGTSERLVGRVETKGMCGTYDDGIRFVRNGELWSNGNESDPEGFERDSGSESHSSSSFPSTPPDFDNPTGQRVLHIMFLGSSIGNFPRDKAASFLRSLPLRAGTGDTLLLGLDHANEKDKIERAYNDKQGYARRFVMNGLRVAGRTLKHESMFDQSKWEYVNAYDEVQRRQEAFFKSKCSQVIIEPSSNAQFKINENELIKIAESMKYSDADAHDLFANANLRPIERWTESQGQYSLWLLERLGSG